MPAPVVVITVLALFAVGYIYYSRYLATKVYALDAAYTTPAHSYRDGIDFVPTNRHIVFAHHFISVAGAAPIVGPAIAVLWGWVPALIWIVVGTIFAAGAHDFGAIVVSVRHKARSIGTLASDVVNKRARVLFLLIIFFLVTMVNAVFAIIIAGLFIAQPGSVLPMLVTIPLAIGVGQLIYRRGTAAIVPSIIALVLVYVCIPLGLQFPITVDPIANAVGLEPATVWILLLFVYAFFASRLPVWMLLQPRDYINQQQMLLGLGIIILAVFVTWQNIAAPAINDVPAGTPPIFPILFITVACGAVSGFHSLVASGTTSKQLDKETDARYVGYMGVLGEGTLALCSIMAVTVGLTLFASNPTAEWHARYPDWTTAGTDAPGRFAEGVGNFTAALLPFLERDTGMAIGTVFGAVVVISFAITTLDTSVRLHRYVIQEIADILRWKLIARNITLATLIAIALPFALAMAPGDFALGTLWRLFGTTNQLTAGLALAVIAVWVTKNRRNPIMVIIPLVFLVIMTTWALVTQAIEFLTSPEPIDAFVLGPLDLIILGLAIWLMVEAAIALVRAWSTRDAAPTATEDARPVDKAAEPGES
ncbi:carbon starvation protein A [Spiractinospora alimapuensis]|uniref:carbon starvation CstA family protein n=1 Tax=Spiractinospora alimapuensis TaxID=2820884 RepID=UPI001F1BBC32|nr:carbon starvation protein A [Spiractinospora alimapuensis]QVQ52977.1 carbon starvation protein A [Spiractinospora alimapuensis]